MTMDTKALQGYCRMVKDAVDTGSASVIGGRLGLSVSGRTMSMDVTNREYYVSVKVPLSGDSEPVRAVVEAPLFLGLISKMTSKEIGLSVNGNSLQVKGNGVYRLPMIYDGGKLAELPPIEVGEAAESFKMDAGILAGMLRYNSSELQKGSISQPVQRMHYVDEKGAITFTSGACVNSFRLEKPVRMLLPDKVVRLFRLFGDSGEVSFSHAECIQSSAKQAKVCFETPSVRLASVIPGEDSMMESVPVKVIRGMAESGYGYSVSLSKTDLLQACGRLMLMGGSGRSLSSDTGLFEFGPVSVTVRDFTKANSETIPYRASTLLSGTDVNIRLSLDGLKDTLAVCDGDTVRASFNRDGNMMLLAHGSVCNIIPLIGD